MSKKSRQENMRALTVVAVTIGVIGALLGGFYIGVSRTPELVAVTDGISDGSLEITSENRDNIIQADFSLFWDAIRTTKKKYIHAEEIDDQKIVYGAIQGALATLHDPYSQFLPPEDAKKFDEDIMGSFGGIGAEIGIRKGQLVIIAPLKGNPAEAAGLEAGDKIIKIDDVFAGSLTIEEAVKMIRGESGVKITFLIMRDDWDEAREISVVRDVIVIPTVEWKMLATESGKPEDIVYIKLSSFNGNANQRFAEAALQALLRGTKGVILDLRNDSGGFLNVAVDISGWFVDRGEMVTQQRFRDRENMELRARGNGALKHIPVVVLINEGSASAAEIVAGALRDLRHAKLVGQNTFGKGSVQELETLKDGSTLKISIAEWLTPNGHSIEKTGLAPDITIEDNSETEADEALMKAIETLAPRLLEGVAAPQILLEL